MNEIVKKNGITFGVIMGVVSVLITATLYAVDLELFVNKGVGVMSMVVYLILGVVVVSRTKKQLQGQITFKEAFTSYFLAAVIGSTISVLFNIVLFNLIDPAAKETLRDITLKYTVESLKSWNVPPSAINQTIKDLQEKDTYAPGSQMFGLIISFILNAILGLILALIFKSKSSQQE